MKTPQTEKYAAANNGRKFIGVDQSAEYAEAAKKLITDAQKTRIIKDLEDQKRGIEYSLGLIEDSDYPQRHEDEKDALLSQLEEIEEEIWNAENLEIIES